MKTHKLSAKGGKGSKASPRMISNVRRIPAPKKGAGEVKMCGGGKRGY